MSKKQLTWFASIQFLFQLLCLGGIRLVSNIVFDEFINFNVLKFVFLGKLLGMISFSTAWRAHKQHARWSSGSLGSCQLQDANYLLKDNALGTVSIELNNLSLACSLHTFDLTT